MEIDVNIRKIGNSKGIILPKQYLEQFGFGERAVLEVDPQTKSFTLHLPESPRQGWAEALRAAPPEPLSEEEQDWLDFDEQVCEEGCATQLNRAQADSTSTPPPPNTP